jgi:prevent-host-death family protein
MKVPSWRVGVRELRQNLSVHLRRVAAGESLEVTDRGRAVAELVPLREPQSPLRRLVESGHATAPAGDLVELGPPRGRASSRLSRALEAVRAERL